MERRGASWLRAAIIVVAGLLLPGWSPALAAEDGTTAPPRESGVAWQGARLAEPGSRKLLVQFWGSPEACVGRYKATAERTGDTMTVTVRTGRPSGEPVMCVAMAVKYTRAVWLPAELEADTVIDGATGEAKPVFDVGALRSPAYLPDGYEFTREEISGARDERRWSTSGRGDLTVSVKDRDPEPYQPGDNSELIARTRVNGHPATVWRTAGFVEGLVVEWSEGEHSLLVSTGGPNPLRVRELLHVARRLT